MSDNIVHVTDSSFEEEVLKSELPFSFLSFLAFFSLLSPEPEGCIFRWH